MRPREPRVVTVGETLVFSFVWPYIAADAAVADSPLRGELARLRRLLLEDITGYLTEVVEAECLRAVVGSVSTVGEDPRMASVSFTLGPTTAAYGEEGEALLGWADQVRRQAREQRLRHRALREELRRLREELSRQLPPP